MVKKKETGFEQLLAETEEIVDTLEEGELGLEESMKLYEKGIANLRNCTKILSEAEEKVRVLIDKTGEVFELEDFEEQE